MTGSALEEPGPKQLGPGSAAPGDDALLDELERAAAAAKPQAADPGSEPRTESQPAAAPKGSKGGRKGKAKGTPAQIAHWERLAELNRQRAKERKESGSKAKANADAAAAATAAAEAELRGSRSSSSKQHSGPVLNPDGSEAGSRSQGSASSEGPQMSDLELETLCKLGWWGVGKLVPKPLGGGSLEDEECEKLGAASMPFVRQLLHTQGGPYGLLAATVLGVFGSRAIAYKMSQQSEGE